MEVLFCGNWVFAALEVQTWVEFLGFDLMCTCDADSLGFLLCKDKDRVVGDETISSTICLLTCGV